LIESNCVSTAAVCETGLLAVPRRRSQYARYGLQLGGATATTGRGSTAAHLPAADGSQDAKVHSRTGARRRKLGHTSFVLVRTSVIHYTLIVEFVYVRVAAELD
jgi:hypothetical protein